MKYYLEITLIPDAEVNLAFILQKVYQQVHIALVDNKTGKNESAIAISFPRYGDKEFPLGNQIRLLANDESQLIKLNINQWLTRFEDYVHIKSIKQVPENVRQVAFVRNQVKGEARIEKDMLSKATRWAEKSGQSIEVCLLELEKSKPKANNNLPFIWLESQETKQRNVSENRKFPLFIKMLEVKGQQTGGFNCYGLSHNHKETSLIASIPQF